MKEWMDLYDCQGRVKGLVHTTTQAPQDGNFYLATRIWVRDAAGVFLLLQCPTDSWTPGQWTVPGDFVARSTRSGRSPANAANPDWPHPSRCPVAEPGTSAPSGQPQRRPLSRHRIEALPGAADRNRSGRRNVVLGETIQAWQWVPAEDVSVFLTDHPVEPLHPPELSAVLHRLPPPDPPKVLSCPYPAPLLPSAAGAGRCGLPGHPGHPDAQLEEDPLPHFRLPAPACGCLLWSGGAVGLRYTVKKPDEDGSFVGFSFCFIRPFVWRARCGRCPSSCLRPVGIFAAGLPRSCWRAPLPSRQRRSGQRPS